MQWLRIRIGQVQMVEDCTPTERLIADKLNELPLLFVNPANVEIEQETPTSCPKCGCHFVMHDHDGDCPTDIEKHPFKLVPTTEKRMAFKVLDKRHGDHIATIYRSNSGDVRWRNTESDNLYYTALEAAYDAIEWALKNEDLGRVPESLGGA